MWDGSLGRIILCLVITSVSSQSHLQLFESKTYFLDGRSTGLYCDKTRQSIKLLLFTDLNTRRYTLSLLETAASQLCGVQIISEPRVLRRHLHHHQPCGRPFNQLAPLRRWC